MATKFEVRDHPHSKKHLLLVVTTAHGYVYASPSAWEAGTDLEANPKPTPEAIRYSWKHHRHEFLPYNESTGTFVEKRKS